MHRILQRQIDKYLGANPQLTPELKSLLDMVSQTYDHFDEDRALLDRSLSLSSKEFLENSLKLQEAKAQVEETVKQRTVELRNEQARLLASIESLSLGFAIFDNQGYVIHANALFSELLDMVSVSNINEIHLPELDMQKIFSDALREGKATTNSKVDFNNKFLHLSLSPIFLKTSSEVIGAVAVIEDATKDEQIDRAKSEFVVLASHQLRTPLTIVKWWIEALKKKIALDQNLRYEDKYIERIEDGTKRMVALVQALLNVSRIEVGKLAIKTEPLKLQEIVKVILDEVDTDIQYKKLEIKEEYDPRVGTVMADPNLLKMMLINLLTNAIKYTPEGGIISIRASKPESKELPADAKPNDYYLISVSDTGLGIPKNQQARIFSKLFRADNVKLTRTSGTGLGLYITKAIASACEGYVWFKSAGEVTNPSKDKFSTSFYVALPTKGVDKREGVVLATTVEDSTELLYS